MNKYIARLVEKYGDRYDYSISKYEANKRKIKILCPEHGVFEQRYDHHYSGSGCQACANKMRSLALLTTYDEFVARANAKHGDKYNYYPSTKMSRRKKITIRCNSCNNDFEQRADLHLNGHGCYDCNRGEVIGFKKSEFINLATKNNGGLAMFYIIRCFNDSESFYKIGITTKTLKQRFTTGKMPYDYELIDSVKDTAEKVWRMEKDWLERNKENQYSPLIDFKGSIKECFISLDTRLTQNERHP